MARLLKLRATGRLQTATVRFAAASLGVSERTVWRWLRQGVYGPATPDRWRLTSEAIEALYRSNGRPTIAWRLLRDEGVPVPGQRTFERAARRELTPGEIAYMRGGENGRRRYSVYRRWEPEARNDVWEADSAQLDVNVILQRGHRPVRPWLTVIIDGYSRVLIGWVMSPHQPTTAEVLAAMHRAIVVDPERGPWGGVPDLIRFDGGKEFLANAVARAAGEIGFAALPTAPYSPHQKGKVERLHHTIAQDLIATLPHYTKGPKQANGQLYAQPRRLTVGELAQRVTEYVDHYNHRRAHRGIGGLTPAEKWGTSARPLDLPDTAKLRWMLLADETRIVERGGINFNTELFVAPELNGRGGERVQIRYMPHDYRQIEIFDENGWLCTARPQGDLSRAEAAEIIEQRQRDNRETGKQRAASNRKARRRFAPITPGGKLEEITFVPSRERPRRSKVSDRQMDDALQVLGRGRSTRTENQTPKDR